MARVHSTGGLDGGVFIFYPSPSPRNTVGSGDSTDYATNERQTGFIERWWERGLGVTKKKKKPHRPRVRAWPLFSRVH